MTLESSRRTVAIGLLQRPEGKRFNISAEGVAVLRRHFRHEKPCRRILDGKHQWLGLSAGLRR